MKFHSLFFFLRLYLLFSSCAFVAATFLPFDGFEARVALAYMMRSALVCSLAVFSVYLTFCVFARWAVYLRVS